MVKLTAFPSVGVVPNAVDEEESVITKKTVRSHSLLHKFVIPFIFIVIGQAALFYFSTLWGGAIQQMELNAYEIFNQKVQNRKNYLQNDMIHRWSNIDDSVRLINAHWEQRLSQYPDTARLLADSDALDDFLMDTSDDLIYILRKNSVTGAFLILDQTIGERSAALSRPGLYVRDSDPESSTSDNSDLAIKNGSAQLYRSLGITTDIQWTPRIAFDSSDAAANSYFYRPMEAAREFPKLNIADLGYWSPPISTANDSRAAVTYSVPLIDSRGVAYGVLGIDLSVDYLKKMLPSGELHGNTQNAYCLAVYNQDTGGMTTAMSSGSVFSRYFAIGAPLSLSPDPLHEGSYLLNTGSAKTIHTDLQPLLLYNTDAPFSAEKWMLLGVTDKNDLLSFPHMVARIAILASIVSCAAAIVLGCAIITLLTRPIRLLINSLRASNPHRPVTLSKLYVTEIDELSSAIEDLSRRVSEASSTLSRIIEVSDINIAAFECDRVSGMVVCTGQFFPLLGLPCTGTEQDSIPIAEFKNAFENNDFVLEEELENGWILRMMADKKPRWIKITMVDEGTRLLGVVVDITEDTLSKRRIEYERDYDLLTNLLNRRAFLAALRKLLETPEELQTAALMLLDLDNLKYINDSYGHDCGDGYLRAMANTIKKLPLQNMVPARMSGDEFFVFLYGFESKEQLRRSIDELKSIIAESYYILPGGETIRIRCSGGIAWYPDDATTLEDLPRFADFAMYVAKNTKKGDFCEFNRQEYNKNSYLLHSREELNKLIEHRLVDYVFQPIVNALTGQVFAYEALMRSRLETLRTPMEILALARAQSKLYDIEKMTWMTALKKATSDPVFLESSCHIFINSVSNHILTEADIEELRASYQKYLSRMVLEVTEEEKFNEELTRHKQAILYSWGGQVALDDFGTGYNGEMVLLQLVPDYVKIDMSIVRNIDTDPSRRELFRNLVSYSHERDIKVIAEGVETLAEMEALIRLGADFLQGYYLGTPQSAMQTLSAEAVKEIQDTAKNCGREASNI